jgi:uncharacterized membrane protein YphA (DoxX/SURF4 family)
MISSSKAFRIVSVALRIALGLVFVYAAWTKLRVPWWLFAASIDGYKVAPEWSLEPLARALPWVELAIGAFLIVGRWLRTAATASSLMLIVFVILMVRAYAAGLQINCGCFEPGATNDIISWRTFLRDGSLLALSLAVMWLSFTKMRKKRAAAKLGPVEVKASLPPQL